jgi:large subunit ribosomal protein L23
MSNFLKKILVSEKSFQSAAAGKYTFVVSKQTDKGSVAKLCEELFGVTVLSANSMNCIGKTKITKRKVGKRADFKKVILTLKKGDKIDLFEIESDDKKAEKEDKKEKKAKKIEENKDVEVKIKEKKKK